MNMVNACWMTRSLGEPVSAVAAKQSNSILAGGWNGALACWSGDGDLQWKHHLHDRIGDITYNDEIIFVTSGLHLVAVDDSTGETIWQSELEGSADLVIVHNDYVYATSSVYNIEHNDFLDSAIWCFDTKGKQIWNIHLSERPWTLMPFEDEIILGLGRPRKGALAINSKGVERHFNLQSKAPVTSGINHQGKPIFGHSNGDISDINGLLIQTNNESIEDILICHKNNFHIRSEGAFQSLNNEHIINWTLEKTNISNSCIGFEVEDLETLWLSTWQGTQGELIVHSLQTGEEISLMNCHRINAIICNNQRVVVGDENGEVFVWDKEMFNRRLQHHINDGEEDDRHRQSMRDKIKALKKR